MAEDGDAPKNQMSQRLPQETFQRAPETQTELGFPNRSKGIVSLPPGSRGPRSLYLRRYGDSFGFTLRHFIVYPPDSLTVDARHAAVGALLAPMDTIFVKHVALYSPAEQAGLQKGDRIVAVNGISVTDKKYSQVVHLIQNSPEYLHLLVVPKEDDVLQKFFAEAAHNPITNQAQRPQEIYVDRRRAQQRLVPRGGVQVDAHSWRTLQESAHGGAVRQKQQRSVDSLLYDPSNVIAAQRSEESIDECQKRTRAQPQVPLIRKMGRRASEGSTLSNPYECIDETVKTMVVGEVEGKGAPAPPRPGESILNYSNMAGNRLSLDGRRQSSSSLSSSLADGSKDSLNSFDSTSTLTGQDTDDSVLMHRLRQSFQKKEEFMRRPSQPTDIHLIPREFYGRPKRLDKPLWPPREEHSPSRTTKPVHQNFQRVKSDIDSERDLTLSNQNSQFVPGGTVNNFPLQKGANSPKDWPFVSTGTQICEGTPAPCSFDNSIQLNGSSSDEDRRSYLTNLQMVSKRTRQFEAGRPLPDDDPKDRTSFYRSELARLSAKHIDPNVTIRAHEYETKATEPRRDNSGSTTNSSSCLRRQHRDSRSLDSSGSDDSSCSINEILEKKLSGNVIIPSGSKYIHVPPPPEYCHGKDLLNDLDNVSPSRMRARSNSADSWAAAIHTGKKDDIDAEDEQVRQLLQEAMDVAERSEQTVRNSRTSPLIPESVQRLHVNPIVSITPAPFPSTTASTPKSPPLRPTQLDLDSPMRPVRRLQSGKASSPRLPISPANSTDPNKPIVVRRIKNTNLADEERAMRRESYLKATGNGRMHVDELSDGEISPVNRRGSLSGGSSSSASLEREKSSIPSSPLEKDRVARESYLHCKIAEIDGKRAADRSWKQVWAVLRGPKLLLYKDRHHQSPSDAADQSLSNGVDMRASCVRVAEDYTKRKHVLRISATRPCRSELLLQAENHIDLAGWVKALQEQVATTDEDPLNASKQPALTQSNAATVRLSPQPPKSKLPSLRNRSPTGQSPVSKTRKPSQTADTLSSPKTKTWRGRMAKQFRKIQGASSPSSPTAPEGSTFGVPLDHCIPSNGNQFVPRLVEVCTEIVEGKGLDIVGVYRVPGNNAAITALTNAVNHNYEEVPLVEVQWNDVHVVSSLLKAFFRKLPDALLTFALYSSFIEADKIDSPRLRMEAIRGLINRLPAWHYHTLCHLMLHLKTVTDHSDVNKMKASNLAIIFGPTLIRDSQDDMATLVNDMSHNYKIVESLICHADWFFSDDDVCALNFPNPTTALDPMNNEIDSTTSRALLLDNISKVEGLRGDQKERREIFSSIICAAQRKMRKGPKTVAASTDVREDLGSPNGIKEFPYPLSSPRDHNAVAEDKNIIPTTVVDMDRSAPKQQEKVPWFNYSSDQDHFRQRIQNFIQETQAHLQRNKKSVDYYDDVLDSKLSDTSSQKSSDFGSTTFPKTKFSDPRTITKTYSASNVFYRNHTNPLPSDNVRNSANSALTLQYSTQLDDHAATNKSESLDLNRNRERLGTVQAANKFGPKREGVNNAAPRPYNTDKSMRRGSSAENINCGSIDVGANGVLKKIKFGNENESAPRTGSLDSIHKMPESDDGNDLQASIMRIFDEKKKSVLNPLSGSGLPFVDASPERQPPVPFKAKENVPSSPKLYRNPSLHKGLHPPSKLTREEKESQKIAEEEKDKDSCENVPDNERHISTAKHVGKLRRSESLNKERTVSPHKLKRSESLTKASDRLKRSDSLTKNEKTESNLSKRRENSRRIKEFKLKRKNGMPERSIKRRHTVGGTKDFDKVNWYDNNRTRDANCNNKENDKEKSTLRTSSPDLSSTRRERLFFEVNLVGPENMVVALRQHLIGARPQSLPEPRIFTVPLESHV